MELTSAVVLKRPLIGLLAGVAALLLLGPIGEANAQDPDSQAEKHVALGRALLEMGRYAEALKELDQAYTLNKSHEYLPDIAMTHEAMENIPRAIEAWKAYLRKGKKRLTPAQRKHAKSELKRLKELKDEPAAPPTAMPAAPAASTTPGGGETGDWERLFYLGFGYERMGNPTAAIEAFERCLAGGAGRMDPIREAEVREAIERLRGGGRPVPASSSQPPGAQPMASTGDGEDSGGRVWTWVAFGAAGAAGVGAAITGTIALKKEEDVRSKCEDDLCPEETRDDIETVMALGPVTDVLIGVAIAGAIAGTILFFVEDSEEPSTSVALTPLPSGGALSLGRTF